MMASRHEACACRNLQKVRTGTALGILLVFVLAGRPLLAQDNSIGKITAAEGPVTIQREDGSRTPAKEGLSLLPGDQISTGKGGGVRFDLLSGGSLRLGEESQVSVDELSSAREEDGISMRLVLGYLWTKIRAFGGGTSGFRLHTPTVVSGVRGTEFETVVALDGSSLVVVDEGSVEVEGEEQRIVVDAGRMTQVDPDAPPPPAVEAPARDKRDWSAWQRQKAKRFLRNLPRAAPRLRNRFERAVERFRSFTDQIRRRADAIRSSMEEIRRARVNGKRKVAQRSFRLLVEDVQQYKERMQPFRKGMNRVRVMGRFSLKVEQFVKGNRGRFSPGDLASIERELAVISGKREELRDIFRSTVSEIRMTIREFRILKKEMEMQAG
ncbi:MAG: FecR domain-containing protein [Deltaproteobacteria bacterium]|nr:FecR domain-containing protein [Deltaproteobacteria bacterium]